LLGDHERIRHTTLAGKRIELPDLPERGDPSGWRVSHYGDGILSRDVALGHTGVSKG